MRVLMICPELPSEESPGSMAPAARQIRSIQDLGIETEIVDMRGVPKLKYVQLLPRIRRLARGVDLIHAHFGYCGWLAKLAPLGCRPAKPVVMSFMGDDLLGTPYNSRGDLELFSRWMVRWNKLLPRRVKQVIVKSHEMANVIAPAPCTVIPNGVDTDVFCLQAPVEARQRLGLNPRANLVLFPGDPGNPRKGHGLAKAAVAHAAELMGQEIELIPLWGIQPDRVADYMNACSAMLMTSLIEGSPNVVKEAMACNLPVLGVPVGDVHEMLAGVTGCTLCARDATEMGFHLARTLERGGRSNGRQILFDRKLDLNSVAVRVASVYSRALGAQDVCAQGVTTRETVAIADKSVTMEDTAEMVFGRDGQSHSTPSIRGE